MSILLGPKWPLESSLELEVEFLGLGKGHIVAIFSSLVFVKASRICDPK